MRLLKPTEYHDLDYLVAGQICCRCGKPFNQMDMAMWVRKDGKYYAAHMADGICDKNKYNYDGEF